MCSKERIYATNEKKRTPKDHKSVEASKSQLCKKLKENHHTRSLKRFRKDIMRTREVRMRIE